ncbi:hypothetical protein J2S75_000696 [Ancylobacter polymorphus]|uniref:Uncharacterized protein n=1 Tax=Ancylobacter polymorphus TaxID=223390 RepID=A0ABU0B792_9HYPH|nr:hypothetical protein [Ancylobacter polymorphus]
MKPNGARVWQQADRFAGKQKKLTHGPIRSFRWPMRGGFGTRPCSVTSKCRFDSNQMASGQSGEVHFHHARPDWNGFATVASDPIAGAKRALPAVQRVRVRSR